MNLPPTDSICSAADFLTSEAYTIAPIRLAVAMACSPATPLPIITNFAGLTVPALVVIIGMALETFEAPSNTALYPERLSWLEFTSMDWALDSLLGIISILIKVIPEEIASFTVSGFLNGSATQISTEPSAMLDNSGDLIETIASQANTSSLEHIVPPLPSYSSSEWFALIPASFSMNTSNPDFDSLSKELGTIATLISPSGSLRTPSRIVSLV